MFGKKSLDFSQKNIISGSTEEYTTFEGTEEGQRGFVITVTGNPSAVGQR